MIADVRLDLHMGRAVQYREAVVTEFVADLRRHHLMTGKPKYSELTLLAKEQRGLRDLPTSTINDLLNPDRHRLPELLLVISFVTVCRIHAERNRICIGHLASVTEWQQRWYSAHSACTDTAPWPVNGGPLTDDMQSVGPARAACARIRQALRQGRAIHGDEGLDSADPPRRDDDEEAGRAAMLALTAHAPMLGWWQDYRDVVPDWFETYLSLEPAASLIRTYETEFIPGLLQTEGYARATMQLDLGNRGAASIHRRVELRMLRQQILHRPTPPTLWAVIDENAFHRPRVGAAIMRAQIERIIDIADQPNVTVQVMPARRNGHATAGGPITILRFPARQLPEVSYLEQLTSGLYPDKQADIHHYREVLDRLGRRVENGAATTRILNRILTDI